MKNMIIRNNSCARPAFIDDFFGDPFAPLFRPFVAEPKFDKLMRTDIKENEKDYSLEIELPGFKKEDIALSLENGYLLISAKKVEDEKEKDNYLRRERSVSSQRSFYVGDVSEEDIKAKYDNGVLTVTVPKAEDKKPEKKGIIID